MCGATHVSKSSISPPLNPKGWQRLAGGRVRETPGNLERSCPHPGGVPEPIPHHPPFTTHTPLRAPCRLCVLALASTLLLAIVQAKAENLEQGEVLSNDGKVNWAQGTGEWSAAQAGQKLRVRDRLRTLALSRAMVQLAE